MKATEKIIVSIAALGIFAAFVYVIVKYASNKKAENNQQKAENNQQKAKEIPNKILSESQLSDISRSFSKSMDERAKALANLSLQTQKQPISLINTQSPIFQPLNLTNKPTGNINFKPKYLNAVGQFGIAGI